MIEELSSTEMAVKLGVSERTVNRWIKDGRLQARLLKNHRYEVDSEHLLSLAVPEHSSAVFDRLTTLEQTVTDLAAEVEQLRSALQTVTEQLAQLVATAPTRATPRQSREQAEGPMASQLPGGLVGAISFGKLHNVPETTIRKAISAGRLPTQKGEWKAGRAIIREALGQEGRAKFYELFSHNEHFLPCVDCPHTA